MAAPAHIARENGKKGGRPKGSITRPQLRDALTQEQIDALVVKAHGMASLGDTTMLKFILEQVYGKAPQQLEVAGPDGEPLAARRNVTRGEIELRMRTHPPEGYSFVSANWKKRKARFVGTTGKLMYGVGC